MIKFRRLPSGAYEVDLDGECIGVVRKWERHYNLRPRSVSRGWRAITAEGEKLYSENGYTAESRRDAGGALLTHYRAARNEAAKADNRSGPYRVLS